MQARRQRQARVWVSPLSMARTSNDAGCQHGEQERDKNDKSSQVKGIMYRIKANTTLGSRSFTRCNSFYNKSDQNSYQYLFTITSTLFNSILKITYHSIHHNSTEREQTFSKHTFTSN